MVVLTFPGKDVGGHPVEEPAVVGDHHGTAGKFQQRIFEALQRLDIQVVGRLVEEQQIAALLQGQSQVQPVALTARQHPGRLLLIGTLETEGRHIGAAGHLEAAHLDVVEPVRDDLPDVLLGIQPFPALVDVADLDGLTDLQGARIRLLLADDHFEQRGLADTVRADHTDDAGARQVERQSADQHPVVEGLVQIVHLEHQAAQPRTRRDVDLGGIELTVAFGVGGQFLVAGQAGLVLGLPGFGRRAHPLEFALQDLGSLGILLTLDGQTLALGLEVGRVVALVGIQASAVDLTDPSHHVVEEVTVVSDAQHRSRVALQVTFQPSYRFGVQVVGGLVEQQQIGLLQQQLAQCHAAPLTARQHIDDGVRRRATQRIHGLLETGIDIPGIAGVELGLQLAHLGQQGVEVGVRIGHRLRDLVESAQH